MAVAATKLGDREHTCFASITFAGTDAARPKREEPDLVKGVQLCNLKPIPCVHVRQIRMGDGPLVQFTEHHLSRPAFLVHQKITENIQTFRSAEVDQAHGIEHPDLAARGLLARSWLGVCLDACREDRPE